METIVRKTISLLNFILLSFEVLLAQEQPNYFPLAVGNKWEYIKLRDVDNWQLVMTITGDTVMDNGNKILYFPV
jgi:hypothetical protein